MTQKAAAYSERPKPFQNNRDSSQFLLQYFYNDFLIILRRCRFDNGTDCFRDTSLLANNLSHIIRSHFEL